MRRLLATIFVIVTLLLGASAVAATKASAPRPPDPAPMRPASIPGCWESLLEKHIQRRTGSYTSVGGQVIRYTEFRTVATELLWCPGSGYKVAVWHGPWHPGRR